MLGVFFNRRETSVGTSASILMLSLLAAHLLGLMKLRLLSHFFGASGELGVFLAADRIPSFIFNFLVTGALSSSFIPIFTRHWSLGERQLAFKFSSIMINSMLLVFGVFSVIFFVLAPRFSQLISWGSLSSSDLSLMAGLSRILLLAQLILMISVFLTSILQSTGRFLAPALSPVLFNLGSIFGLLVLSPWVGIYGPAWGVVIGATLHLLFQVPFIVKLGYRHRFYLELKNPSTREAFALLLPRALGLAADQVNLFFDTALSLSLSTSSVVILSFAQRLQYIPVVFFGATLAQASLPTLSSLAKPESPSNLREFKSVLVKASHQLFYLILPVSILLFVLRLPAVRLVFGTRRFDWEATLLTGYTLAFYSLGIFSQGLTALLVRAFFAFKDTRTPLKVGLLSVSLNVFLSLVFTKVFHFNVWSLALASSVSASVNAGLLFRCLELKVGRFGREALLGPVAKIFASGLVMGLFIYLPLKILDQGGWGSQLSFGTLLLDTRYTLNLIFLTLLSSASGLMFYLLLTSYLRVSEGRRILHLFLKFRSFGRYFSQSIPQE